MSLALRFLQSASDAKQLPDSRCEVALIGRSNVGKSSLLNAVANRKSLARTSKAPGATRLLNIFEVEGKPGHWLVDLPGYGFAKAPKADRHHWQQMMNGYLIDRPTLTQVLLLIDGLVGPTSLDMQTIEWLTHHNVALRPIATKADKVKSSRRSTRRNELAQDLGIASGDVLWTSAAKGQGIPELRAELAATLKLHP
ncbi:MAG: YihA family ribosome biogenesis GTP-binding protein [Acidimicrobiia bacterium]|nr:YihA family ribosome biogenesis GTP-binding protein [Acidimicrobiia bacterium]MYC57428.1 YihA family ribosome biogenesis GTP-binding protein [Acidimicrobiia bacterium]MYG93751.1 YihA family ribosome biogenesis GTP-binding protein [Acidimicrobiia bacterium]MYI30675.1 YihA family ribosome biogenesis GTP-binding protein [Acidimicrobiia bacterium]